MRRGSAWHGHEMGRRGNDRSCLSSPRRQEEGPCRHFRRSRGNWVPRAGDARVPIGLPPRSALVGAGVVLHMAVSGLPLVHPTHIGTPMSNDGGCRAGRGCPLPVRNARAGLHWSCVRGGLPAVECRGALLAPGEESTRAGPPPWVSRPGTARPSG
jgi:hypothetical protein